MTTFRRGVLLCLLLAATAGCDRVTKHYAITTLAGQPGQSFLGDTVRLDYQENQGGFLSAGARWSPHTRIVVFQIANGAFLLGALLFARRYTWSKVGIVGLALFLAGGFSNLIDRIAVGTVVDFMNVGIGPVRTGIFNVADVAIMVGAGVLAWEARRNSYITEVSLPHQ